MKYPDVKPKQGEESKPDRYPADNIQLAGPKQKDQDEFDEPSESLRSEPNGEKTQPPKRGQ